VKASDYGGALESWSTLYPLASPELRKDLQTTIDQILAVQRGSQPVILPAKISDSSNWYGTLLRNRFSIDVKNGTVSEIKLRCEKQYLFFKYQPGIRYSIGQRKDQCGLEVVGDPGTKFVLVQ
jgi:hypothetical protein